MKWISRNYTYDDIRIRRFFALWPRVYTSGDTHYTFWLQYITVKERYNDWSEWKTISFKEDTDTEKEV